MELYEYTISELHEMLITKKTSSFEITKSILGRISKIDKEVNAYLEVYGDFALNQARIVDDIIDKDDKISFLTGIPIIIKDNICVKGWEITCASKILKGFYPPYNATVIEKLKDAGTVLIGRANMDEFAMGSSTENSSFFTTKNPWDTSRIPGGSSGGTF